MPEYQENTNKWVSEIATTDSQAAFKSLYYRYFDRLLRFAFLYIPNTIEAEEVVSDVFVSIWNNRHTLLSIHNFEAYLYAMTRNKSVSYLRSRRDNKVSMQEISVDLFAHTETTPEDELINQEKIDQLNNAINDLPYKCKMAFKLVREDKMKYREVAEILDISIKTVESHILTATRRLREALGKYRE